MKTNYQRPILTSIFYVLGILALVGAAFCIQESFSSAITIAVAGIMYIGIGQVVAYLARTAQCTDRLCTLIETSIIGSLTSIEGSLSPATPLTVRIDATAPLPGPKALYYYSVEGTQQGPVPAEDLKRMHGDGLVTDDTPVLRQGQSEWRPYKTFPNLSK